MKTHGGLNWMFLQITLWIITNESVTDYSSHPHAIMGNGKKLKCWHLERGLHLSSLSVGSFFFRQWRICLHYLFSHKGDVHLKHASRPFIRCCGWFTSTQTCICISTVSLFSDVERIFQFLVVLCERDKQYGRFFANTEWKSLNLTLLILIEGVSCLIRNVYTCNKLCYCIGRCKKSDKTESGLLFEIILVKMFLFS